MHCEAIKLRFGLIALPPWSTLRIWPPCDAAAVRLECVGPKVLVDTELGTQLIVYRWQPGTAPRANTSS